MPTWLDEMAGDDDLSGSDIGAYGSIGDVGWPWKRKRRGKRVALRRLQSATPGAPAHGWAQEPLGLTSASFTSTSGVALTVTARPQKAFKARRLFFDLTRTGATATGLVSVTNMLFGVTPCTVGSQPLPITMFGSTAVDSIISFPPISGGLDITVFLAITTAPTTTDRVDVQGAFLGETIG